MRHELLNRQEVVKLVENMKKKSPELVEELIPTTISYGNFQKILTNLLKEGIPVKDMETHYGDHYRCIDDGQRH